MLVSILRFVRLTPCVLLLFRAGIGAVPIVDAEGRVVGIYSRSDITFLATAADPGAVLRVIEVSYEPSLHGRLFCCAELHAST